MNIQEVRQKYPQYADMSDGDLASALHAKFYSDIPFEDFAQKVGLQQQPQPKADEVPRFTGEWKDVPFEAARNTFASAGRMAGGLANAVAHPVDTASGLMDAAAGGLRNLTPSFLRNIIDKADPNTQNAERASAVANAVGDVYKQRYGGGENIKNTLATDPVGVLGDLSMVLGGGGAAVSKVAGALGAPGIASKAAGIANVGNEFNPITLAAKGVKAAGKGVGMVATQPLSLSTGVSPETLRQAASSGLNKEGAFIGALRGEGGMGEVVSQARDALQAMRDIRNAKYKTGIALTEADATPIKFAPVEKAFDDVVSGMTYKGHWTIDQKEISTIKQIQDVLSEWKADPSMHTAMGMDALKRRIDAIYPESPAYANAQRAVSQTRTAVKNAIVEQSPKYAETMKTYETALKLEKEIESAFSLGKKKSVDTALRKLQSLARNDVSSNYGFRQELFDALKQGGNQDLMPTIAGQAMSSWLPRGLVGRGAMGATVGTATFLHNPAMLATLPFQSPKAMGYALYGGGRAARGLLDTLDKTGMTPEQLKWASLISAQYPQQ